jgi:hypothetical protein
MRKMLATLIREQGSEAEPRIAEPRIAEPAAV